MAIENFDKDVRRKIFTSIKLPFKEKLGKYTHQRISDEWHFYGLGFVRDDMTYVFGFNVGFFKKDEKPNLEYSHVGLNVLVRTNGINLELREKYRHFFEENLKNWANNEITEYTSFRGGNGVEFPRVRKISEFNSDEEIINFLIDGIEGIQKLYPLIAENPEGIFSHVVRAAPPWHDTLLQLAMENPITKTSS